MTKKILLLGGSHFQVPSVKTAKRMGLYTITCDYLPDNPGHKFADEYHNVSTTDREAVLALARRLNVDGVVCYASDPAAATAAYVSEQMGFPTSPLRSVEILTNKDLFRKFLADNGFNVPRSRGYAASEIARAVDEADSLTFPVMIKPVDSSGSKGVKKLTCKEEIAEAAQAALAYSRAKRFIIEEYVEKHGYQIAGDGFSVDGRFVFRCFGQDHFDPSGINPYVPVGPSYPCIKSKEIQDKVHDEIQRALTLLRMKTQAFNFDIRVDKDDRVWLMEIGPRNGGNLVPQVTQYATGVDMVEYTIKAAMGEDCSDLSMVEPKGYWGCYVIHSQKSGTMKKLWIDEEFKRNCIVELDVFNKPGDNVEAFTGSNGTLGTMILRFASQDEMLDKMDDMQRWVDVEIEPLTDTTSAATLTAQHSTAQHSTAQHRSYPLKGSLLRAATIAWMAERRAFSCLSARWRPRHEDRYNAALFFSVYRVLAADGCRRQVCCI